MATAVITEISTLGDDLSKLDFLGKKKSYTFNEHACTQNSTRSFQRHKACSVIGYLGTRGFRENIIRTNAITCE